MKPRFTLFYPDREIADDGEDVEVTIKVPRAWLDAPADGMQAIVKHRADGKLMVYDSRDFYFLTMNGELYGTDDITPVLRAAGLLKNGLQLPDEEFAAVRERMRTYRKNHDRGR